MKIAIHLTVSLLAITWLFSIADAEVYTEDQFSEFYYRNLHRSLWSSEIYIMVEQFLSDLELWILKNQSEILEKGLAPNITHKFAQTFANATTGVKALLVNSANLRTCKLTLSLQENIINIANILSGLRDSHLAIQWYDINRRFKSDLNTIRHYNLKRFVNRVDDEVRFLLENGDKENKLSRLRQWYDEFYRRHYKDNGITRVLEIRSFLPRTDYLPDDCDYRKLML
ncbi:uncharacterized protein LOC142224100 [Haematobia irritans]|uniref:uncharacterized protein LOC142224100 n=1 Tax=Haematobia irritans TaxID=7368 RepID=UPI003F4F6CF6